ncbi:MAG: VOC family protein [Ilumatobacteraceae bacterium]
MSNPTPAATGEPCWIDLMTTDTAGAQAFYGELFGWTSEVGGPEYGGYITFSNGDRMVAGCMFNDGTQGVPNVWSVYLASDDTAATVTAAEAAGATVVVAPMDIPRTGVMAFLVDPSGAAIGVFQAADDVVFGYDLAGDGDPGWFELHTKAFVPAITFYEQVFGWDTHAVSDSDEFRYSTLGAGDEQKAGVMDASSQDGDMPSYWTVYFRSPDVDVTVAKATELGGTVVMKPEDTPYGRLAVVQDPAGAAFSLVGPTT